MLPDFTKAKARAERDLIRTIEKQVPMIAPLLKDVATVRQHEGQESHLTRADRSKTKTTPRLFQFPMEFSRDDLKRSDLSIVQQRLLELAQQIADAHTKRMIEVVNEAADEVGNVVHANGELTQDKLLEVFRKVEMDFDPKTMKLTSGHRFVMHPETAAKVIPKVQEWEQDPEFRAEYERIMATKREEWRAREARRKLVD